MTRGDIAAVMWRPHGRTIPACTGITEPLSVHQIRTVGWEQFAFTVHYLHIEKPLLARIVEELPSILRNVADGRSS